MSITITNSSRLVAVAVGAGLVLAVALGGFAAPAHAALSSAQVQSILSLLQSFGADSATIANVNAALTGTGGGSSTGGSASASCNFSRDLTIGSSGADVTCLQQALIAGGFSIPAGATGYFGTQTQSAVAAWQLSRNIAPAAGYFGPISRAGWNLGGSSSGGGSTGGSTGGGSSSGSLSGGEANLTDFDFVRDEANGSEGENEAPVATAQFDVEDGDVRVERIEIEFDATNGGLEDQPWQYFDSMTIWGDGEELATVDAGDRDEWDETTTDVYEIVATGLDYIVREDDQAEISITVDITDGIDTADLAQTFDVTVNDEAIRATDSEGIQQYTGDTTDTINFGFDAEETGDLDLESNSDNPDEMTLIADANDDSEAFTVFAFDIDNNDNVDVLVTDITIDVATSTGDAIQDILEEATLSACNDEFDGDINADGTIDFEDIDCEIAGDDTEAFEVSVVIAAGAPDSTLEFSVDEANVQAESADDGEDSTVSGTVTGSQHTVAANGVVLNGTAKSSDANDDDSIGTFTLEFTVEALEDDVYIYNGADNGDNDATPFSTHASTTGLSYTIYRGGTALTAATTTDSATVQSGAELEAGPNATSWWLVNEGDTEEFTLTVSLSPDGSANTALYNIELDALRFDDSITPETTADDTLYTVPNDSEFETNPITLD